MECTHHECKCARAEELASMGLLVEALELHTDRNKRVRCRREELKNEAFA